MEIKLKLLNIRSVDVYFISICLGRDQGKIRDMEHGNNIIDSFR